MTAMPRKISVVAPTVLIADDDPDICSLLSHLIAREGYKVETAHDGVAALEQIRRHPPDVLLTDLRMPRMDGVELLKQAKLIQQDLPVIVLTGYAGVNGAVEAMKAGAIDYLAKPFDNRQVVGLLQRVLHLPETDKPCEQASSARRLRQQDERVVTLAESAMIPFEAVCGGRYDLAALMGPSASVHKLERQVRLVACSNFSVIIEGGTGAGKEVVAKAICAYSPRASGPFIPVDCGAIPENLLESELFGHEKGAFTGADRAKQGKFVAARGGTLLLDEIANMPLASQAKLLRVLQEKIVFPVGSNRPVPVDVRLIVASHENLQHKVAAGTFREDLYYRLNEFTIRVPSLCERQEDLVYLAQRFIQATNRELGKRVTLSVGAIDRMRAYSWPGNVRELRAVVRRAVLLAETRIDAEHLNLSGGHERRSEPAQFNDIMLMTTAQLSLKDMVRDYTEIVERKILARVLEHTCGNKAEAARILQVDYKTLLNKIKRYDLMTQRIVQ